MADMSWLGNAIGGTMSGILGLIGTGITNTTNQNIANQNLGFQRENLDYQKALQREIFEREDNAYQRSVNDMRLAGMNPLAMQGTNGAGEAIATEPMHNDYQYQDMVSSMFNAVNQFMSMRNNSSLANAQANLINEQANTQKIQNIYQSDILYHTLQGLKKDNLGKDFQNRISNIKWLNDWRDYNFNEQFGLSNNMPDLMKAINIATHQGNTKTSFLGGDVDEFIPDSSFHFNNIQSLLDKNLDFKGAIMENALGKILFNLLGIK